MDDKLLLRDHTFQKKNESSILVFISNQNSKLTFYDKLKYIPPSQHTRAPESMEDGERGDNHGLHGQHLHYYRASRSLECHQFHLNWGRFLEQCLTPLYEKITVICVHMGSEAIYYINLS